MSENRLEEFSLRGIYRVDQFWPIPNTMCDLCLRVNASNNRVPAVCRQIEWGGDVPPSMVARPVTLVDPAGKPLALTQSADAVKNPLKRERGLCKRHLEMTTEDAITRGLIVLRYEKYDYTSLNELPPEWRGFYSERLKTKETQPSILV